MWLVSSFEMIVILLVASIPVWWWICYLNLNLTFWMRNVWVETTIVLTLWWVSAWLVCSVACCSGFVDATSRLWAYVLLSVIERTHLFAILLHINIFTLHSHRTRRSAIFVHTIGFGTDASLLDLWVGILVNVVDPIDSMSLDQSWAVAASTSSSFAWVDVAVR